jgi:hypothetical protein
MQASSNLISSCSTVLELLSWSHRDVAALAMEVEATWNIHDLETIRNQIDGWRVVAVLRKAGLASLAAERAA